MCEMLGYTNRELYSKPWDELIHPDDVQIDQAQIDGILNNRVDVYESVEFFITTLEDITEQKRLKEELAQAQKLEAVGTLAVGLPMLLIIFCWSSLGIQKLTMVDAGEKGGRTDHLEKTLG